MGLVCTKNYNDKGKIFRAVEAPQVKEKEAATKASATNKWITELRST